MSIPTIFIIGGIILQIIAVTLLTIKNPNKQRKDEYNTNQNINDEVEYIPDPEYYKNLPIQNQTNFCPNCGTKMLDNRLTSCPNCNKDFTIKQ